MRRALGTLLGICFLCGCVFAPLHLRLYETTTGEVITGIASNNGSGHGTIELQLPNGEIARGEYTTMPGGSSTWGTIWGQVYGTAVITDVPNEQSGSFVAVTDSGTVIECEYRVNLLNHGRGACKDNNRRLYRLLY